jgi:uncharacterized protein YndB with AHSA1/START domain
MMTKRTVTHGIFTIERRFDASPKRVFNAFADPKAKARWFGGPPEWGPNEKTMDFRVGGRETNRATPPGSKTHSFEALYYDIVPDERIVYAYEMHIGDERTSVSLATIQFSPDGAGTHLKLTEQGAFLDAFDNPKVREEGTIGLIDKLEASLKSDQ